MGRMKLTVLKYSNLVEVATNKLKGILSHYEHEPSNKELLTLVEEVVFNMVNCLILLMRYILELQANTVF